MKKVVPALAAAIACGITLYSGAAADAGPQNEPTPIGHQFIVRVDSGLVTRQAFAADGGTATITVVDPGGTSVPSDFHETVDIFVGHIAYGVYQVSWIESSGVEISVAQNLLNGTENVFYSYTGPDGKRHGQELGGTLTKIS